MKKYGIRPVIGLSILIDIGEGQVVLLYVYAKDDEGYRNLLKMSSAVAVRESETLPLQWLIAYSAGCIIICPMTDISWDGCQTMKKRFKLFMNVAAMHLWSLV